MTSDHRVGDRTWRPSAWGHVVTAAYVVFGAAYVVGAAVVPSTFPVTWFMWLFLAFSAAGVTGLLAELLRSAYRVTVRRDGTLVMVRPIGTATVRLDRVTAVRFPPFDSSRRSFAVWVRTEHGTYRIQSRLSHAGGLAEAMRAHNPRIELPPSR